MKHTDKKNMRKRLGCHLFLWRYLFAGIVLLLMTVPASWGQWPVSQQGHLLDANRRVGSMGLNPTASREVFFPRVNLMMTGNARGGMSFQGTMPYNSEGELNTIMSSSTLSNFRRDSTGQSDLSRGFSPIRPYFDSSRSVTGTRGGRIVQSDRAFRPINTSVRNKLPRSGSFSGQKLSMAPINQRALSGDSSISGMQAGLGRALLSPRFNQGGYFTAAINPGLQPTAVNPAAPLSPTIKPLQPLDLRVQPDVSTGTGDLTDIQQKQQQIDEMNRLNQQQGSTFNQYRNSAMGTTVVSNPVNRNVFSGGGTTIQRSSSLSSIFGKTSGSIRPTALTTSKRGVKLQEPPVGGDYLHYGRQLMQQKHYIQAVEAFDKAIQNNPTDSVGYREKGHAQIAAGAFVSAAENINQTFVRDPELGLTKIDLPELLAIFQQRLSELDRLQKQAQNPSMLFLKGYILYQIGSVEQAKVALEKAKRIQPSLAAIEHLLEAIGE